MEGLREVGSEGGSDVGSRRGGNSAVPGLETCVTKR